MANTYIATCGLEVREDEGWKCPFFTGRGRPDYSSCQIDLQIGTNVCVQALMDMDYSNDDPNNNDV